MIRLDLEKPLSIRLSTFDAAERVYIKNCGAMLRRRVWWRYEQFRKSLSKLGLGTISLAFISLTQAYAQFEGIVQSKNVTTDELGRQQSFIMTMWIKKDMVRIETKGAAAPTSTMLYRTDMKKIFMLNDEEKTYFEISQDEKAQEVFASGGTTAKYSVKKTGKKKKIASYLCDEYLIGRETEETQIWGTKKLAHLVTAISKALGQEHASIAEGATHEVMKMGIYPMASSTKLDGNVIESQEVTLVEAKPLDVSLFTLPASYKKQKAFDMMQGVQEEKK